MIPAPTPTPETVQAAAEAAPWWGVPVIAGAFLVIGALLGFLFNWIADARKAKREHTQRWHDEVRKLSVEAVAAARAVHEESVIEVGLHEVPDPDDQPKADGEIALSRERAQAAYDKLLELLGGMNLVAPDEVNNALSEMASKAFNVKISQPYQASESRDELRPAVTAFLVAVRKHLGVE